MKPYPDVKLINGQSLQSITKRRNIVTANVVDCIETDFPKMLRMVLNEEFILHEGCNTSKTNKPAYSVLIDSNHTAFLTNKQLECLIHLATGKTMKQIASVFNCSISNIETYFHTIKRKFSVFTTTALIKCFWKAFINNNIK